MRRPQAKPALTKAPRKPHPYHPGPAAIAEEGGPVEPALAAVPAASTTERKVWSTRLDPDVKRALKRLAAERDTSIEDLVNTALREYVDKLS